MDGLYRELKLKRGRGDGTFNSGQMVILSE